LQDFDSNRGPTNPLASHTAVPGLQRRLGAGIAMAVVVGSVIGGGIFYKPGVIAAEAGNFNVIIGVWIFGGLFCLLGALCFAELATMFPQAGGLYVYLREAYGRPVAFSLWVERILIRKASVDWSARRGVCWITGTRFALGNFADHGISFGPSRHRWSSLDQYPWRSLGGTFANGSNVREGRDIIDNRHVALLNDASRTGGY